MTERLAELAARCAGSVTIDINDHRATYETVEEWLLGTGDDPLPAVVREMIERDTTVAIQFYPSTPIGFHVVVHYDIAAAVEMAHAILDMKVAREG